MSRSGRVGSVALLVAVLTGLLLPGLASGYTPQHTKPAEFSRQARGQLPQALARIELASLTPRVVTSESEPVVRVSGRVVNVGDRSITKLGVRLQRDEPLTTDASAAAAVRGVPSAPYVTRFRPLPEDLAPGQSSAFEFEVALRGSPDLESLQIDRPGVYPLLVNLNGKPDFGGTARLASVPLLLPVLGVPPAETDGSAPPGPKLTPSPEPTRLTIVWPLAAEPARLPTGPDEPILIASDRADTDPMAVQLAPGGRLDGLVSALEQFVPPGSPLASAVCVAIDPQLLDTVHGMGRGYQVAHPGGVNQGTGAADAQNWLNRLRQVVHGRCVLPLPYADPDLVALSRAGLTDLEALAGSTGVRVLRDLLEVQPLNGVVWPPGGVLDERTLADLTALQTRTVLLEPRGISPRPPRGTIVSLGTRVPGSAHTAPSGLLVDPLLNAALDPRAGLTDDAGSTQTDAGDLRVPARPTDTPDPLAAQDGLGALVYRAAVDPDPEPVLLTPPRRWRANSAEAGELLRTAALLIAAGFFVPQELAGLADRRPEQPVASVDLPPSDTDEIGETVTEDVLRARDMLRDLQVATERDAAADVKPSELLDPLRLGLLGAMSSAWSHRPDRAAQSVDEVLTQLDELRRSIQIVPPPGPYTLAASDSPLLITVSNELPVGVQVQLTLSETPGLRAAAVGVQQVPARSTRQFVIPAEVVRTGQFTVSAQLSTPSGTPLGTPSTLHLRSTAFGTGTIVLTTAAGLVLLVLVARRVVRRVRGTRETESQETGATS